MSDDQAQREREEAERLRRQINSLIGSINRVSSENAQLERELQAALSNLKVLIANCGHLDVAVFNQMSHLSKYVEKAEISTKEVFDALQELSDQYFMFKNISTASKNATQFTDEYYTKFSYYNDLRRIAIGCVVGMDTNIISSESLYKTVEKAYLQNTEYWLAYCAISIMLWSQNKQEAAERAMDKGLSLKPFNACLFYLLINLRFSRIDAAKQWYLNYLDRIDMRDLGEEWQYLLQAYLMGAFGADLQFQEQISDCFKNMLSQVEVTTVDFGKKFSDRALAYANLYLHRTEHEYATLKSTCSQYGEMKALLSNAEKNARLAKDYKVLAEKEEEEETDLAGRIENVLYSLVNNYDDDELVLVKKIKYNEAVVSAKGDVTAATNNYNAMFAHENQKKTLGDLLLHWAFADEPDQVELSVKRFSVSLMKEWIARGYERFAQQYIDGEAEKYEFDIDGCRLTCGEDDFEVAKPQLEKYYDKNKLKNTLKDKYIKIYIGICAVSVVILALMTVLFSPVALTVAILAGLAGSFLLWRRVVDMGKILREKKRKGVRALKQALAELEQWRSRLKEEHAKNEDLITAVERF